MSIQRLNVRGLRNLRSAKLDDCGRINILSGPNGGGKTSFLEAIYLLGLGRSFRGGYSASIINYEMDDCTVYGELKKGQGENQGIGILKGRRGKPDLRINKRAATNIAELAAALPLQLINSAAFALIDGGPSARRQFMDWGVFHVKPTFLGCWRKAQRCLRQRNALLKTYGGRQPHGRAYPSELAVWDAELELCAAEIDDFRARYINELYPLFSCILQQLIDLPEVSLDYQRGWKQNQHLQEALEAGLHRDVKQAITSAGPHRANIDINVGGQPAADALSRGQLKLVISSLKLAQGAHLAKYHDSRCIYLIDDLPAELDVQSRAALCRLLDEIDCQIFITSVDADVLDNSWRDKSAVRQFHVKHGQAFSR